ncbi:hypothetical protein [[Ruminococcus] torques]|uniref:hypothetical protein n=1 Tax=[Ruminococcus] torques TaxID=33039 RepID=UPI0024317C7A|nr:hypothetical protein [[Ruminococcus] torques]
MKKKQKLKERICALVLALAMVLTWVLPDAGMTVQAAAGDAKKVTLKFKDAAEETRGIGALTLKLQSNDDPSYEKKKEIEVKAGETSKEIELKEGVEYNYEVEKTGYETTKDGRFTVEAEKADIDILLTMSEITLLPTTDSVSLKVGETYDISVTNPVQELAYTWSTTDGNVASVENGKVTAKGEGSADISVTNGVKTKTVSVNVSKNQINGFSMTVKEPSGDDQSSVILTAKGLPADVSGNVIFYDVTGGQKTLLYKAEAAATVEYTYETDSLLGAKQFEAVYSGNEKYEGATATATGSYGKTQAITIDGDVSKEVTYGTEHWNDEIVIALADIENTLKGRTLAIEVAFAQSEDAPNTGLAENVANVRVEADHTIHVIPNNAGKITIKIKAVPGEGNFYREASVDYTLTVKRQEVSFENVTWNEASKVYDGNTEIELTGTVNTEKITIPKEKAAIAGSDVAVNEQKKAQPQNVTVAAGIYYTTVDGNGTANYQLVVEEGQNVVQNAATITHRPLYLTSANKEPVELSYGQDLKIAIEKMTGLVALCNGNGVVEEVQGVNPSETGLVGNDQITVLPGATAPETLHVNEAAYKVIVPNIKNENKISGNYEFKFIEKDDYKGDLKVTKQTLNKEDLLKKIDLKGTTNGIYGVKNNADELEKVWVSIGGKDELGEKKGTPVLKMNVKATQYYDEVYMSVDNGNSYVNVSDESDESQNILEQLKPEEGIQDKVAENVKVYLKNSEDKSGNTVTEVTNLTDWLHIDNEAPRAVIKDYDTTKYSDAFESLSFNMFKNEIYTAEISVSDTSGDSVEGSGLHNTTTQKYCVYEMGTDETALKLDKDAVKSIIEKVDSGQEQSWSKLELDKNGKDEITVGKAKDKEAAENNYLILVKTIDNTGNEAVYASNGIVVDVTEPKVECTFDTSKDGGYVSEKDGILCYQGDAKYELKIEDPEEYFSSISMLKVEVSKNGKAIEAAKETLEKNKGYSDSYIINFSDDENEAFTYAELKENSEITIAGVVQADTIRNTNDVKIMITAYDKAGNVSQLIEQRLACDLDAPEISVSFENEKDEEKTGKEHEGCTYYQDTTVMEIEYTDRNFPNKAEYEKNIYFDFKQEGDAGLSEGVTLEELRKKGIGVDIDDSQLDTDFIDLTDERTVTVKLIFDDQDKYEIKPYCVDMFGNEGKTKETYKFAVDTEAPVIEYTYEYLDADNKWNPLNDENDVKLKNAPIRVNVTVTDHFFSLKDNFVFEEKDGKQENTQVKTTLTANDANDAEGKIPNYQEQADTWTAASSDDHPVGWTHNGDEHSIGFVFKIDANYTFKLDYKDLSGRSKNTGDLKFTVDKTSPSGKILVDGTENWYAEFWNTITFNIFKDDNYNVKVTGADITSGVKTIEYYTTKDAIKSADEVKKITDWKKLADSGEWNRDSEKDDNINNKSFTMTEEQQFLTYAKITDYAGNVTYLYPKEIAVLDRTWAEPKITITAAEPLYGIYNKDVPFSINVEDPESGETYSGLKEVYYEVRKDGAVTQSGNYNKELEIDYSKNNQESAQKAGLTILDGRVQSLVKNETVTASLNNSNDVEIYVKVVDNAGHETEATKDLKIDITHPTIAVTYDLNTPLNERYYKDVRTATVVVTERNFDESAVRFNITNTDGTQPAISGWTHSANAGVSDDATHTCQVTFAADGDYTFTLETTDLAGNASSYNRVDDFTIDRTVPTIQVSYDNNSAATPGYFNANRTATVTVNEHNFNAAGVNAQITAALQGSGVAAPGLGGWSTNGDVHTASVTFSADADYTFDVDYTDLAGNAAADYTQDKFTVDKTDPEVEFFDIEDKSANNGTVAPGVKYSDVNYMESGVDITIKGAKHDKTELSGNRTNIANGESIKMEDFKHDEETDDVYTMTAVIKDKAGNETEKEVMFSVNRFGSNYIFSETTEKFLDDVYANKPKDLVVTEVNVDSLVFNGISYGLDGTKKELKAGSDYTVKQSGGEGSWKEYTYTIKKENFEKEGRYSVTIDSEDKATNKMNNKVKECNIDFVIDKTPPTVVITGIEESSYRADEREMTINLSDNTAVKSVDVIIDGKSVATYAQKEIEKAGGKISYMIEGASEPQKIEAAALDMAGNETTSEMHKVLVTSSVWIQYINNTPLLIGSILGIVLVAGGLIWFFVIRKKKEESK